MFLEEISKKTFEKEVLCLILIYKNVLSRLPHNEFNSVVPRVSHLKIKMNKFFTGKIIEK